MLTRLKNSETKRWRADMTDFHAMNQALVSCDADGLEKMESGDMFIPEVLMAAHAMGYVILLKGNVIS